MGDASTLQRIRDRRPVSHIHRLLTFASALMLAASACGQETTRPSAPVTLALVGGNGQRGTAGQPLANPLVIRVGDASGAGVAGVTVTWAVVNGGGSLSSSSTVTDQSGQTLVTLTLGPIAGTNTVSANVASLAPVSFTATGLVGPAAKLAFAVQPSSVTAGAAISPALQVIVQDAQGNTDSAAANSVSLVITSGTRTTGATLSGTLSKSAASGTATFTDISIDKAGTGYTLTAMAVGLSTATSNAFVVSAGAAAKLAFTVPPANTTAGAAISPAVQVTVLDAEGNTVTSATSTITLAITGGTGAAGATLGGSVTQAAASGIAAFSSLTIDKASSGYTLTATASGLAAAISAVFTVNAGVAARLTFAAQPSNVIVGSAIAPAVQVVVQDAQGNNVNSAVTSITVSITSGTGTAGAVLSGTATKSTASGVGSFSDLSIDKVGGAYALTASAAGLTSTTSTAFNVVAPFVSASAGDDHTCGVVADGAAYCWGSNANGQLGYGPDSYSPTPVAVSGGFTFATVSAGWDHTCGVTTGGAAYCWGNNAYGALGSGSTGSGGPVAVSGGLTFAAVSAGLNGTCGLTTGGAAYCWGDGEYGQLGNGSATGSNAPVAVSGGLNFAMVSIETDHACGVTSGGAAYCWGNNAYGQLGDGSTTNSNTPVAVSGALMFATVSAGWDHSCGLTSNGVAYCWGNDTYGALGDGSTASSSTLAAVSGGLTFGAISAGFQHTCGLTTNGQGYCWGRNGYGAVGPSGDASTPTAVSGGHTFIAISAGALYSCGVTTDGAAYCWGYNNIGQLGNGTTTNSTIPVRVSYP